MEKILQDLLKIQMSQLNKLEGTLSTESALEFVINAYHLGQIHAITEIGLIERSKKEHLKTSKQEMVKIDDKETKETLLDEIVKKQMIIDSFEFEISDLREELKKAREELTKLGQEEDLKQSYVKSEEEIVAINNEKFNKKDVLKATEKAIHEGNYTEIDAVEILQKRLNKDPELKSFYHDEKAKLDIDYLEEFNKSDE